MSQFYKYNKEHNIHIIDYSGKIDLQTGLSRIEQLEKYFREHEKTGVQLKVLLDSRYYEKYSPEVHDELAKIARSVFYEKYEVKLAVVDANYANQLSDSEAWFTDLAEAIKWLI